MATPLKQVDPFREDPLDRPQPLFVSDLFPGVISHIKHVDHLIQVR